MLESGAFIRGPNYRAFQEEAAAYLGVKETVGVANGTDALVLALDAMGIGPGDEVICPAFTFYATAESIARRGATPVFADIDPVTLNIDPEDVAAKITDRTRAIMPVHLFGRPAPLDELVQLGLPVDRGRGAGVRRPGSRAAGRRLDLQLLSRRRTSSASATAGSSPRATRSSPSACACSRSTARATSTTSTSSATTRASTSSRPAFLRVFLPQLDELEPRPPRGRRAVRRARARRARRAAAGRARPHLPPLRLPLAGARPRSAPRSREAGIGTATYYTTPLHLQPALRFLGYEPGSLPETERVAEENFSVPLWPGMPVEAQERVVDVVRSAVGVAAEA